MPPPCRSSPNFGLALKLWRTTWRLSLCPPHGQGRVAGSNYLPSATCSFLPSSSLEGGMHHLHLGWYEHAARHHLERMQSPHHLCMPGIQTYCCPLPEEGSSWWVVSYDARGWSWPTGPNPDQRVLLVVALAVSCLLICPDPGQRRRP